jgi:transcription termination factor NusB
VELAKEFGTAESGKFVNGVLDRVMNPAAAAAPEGG